MTVRELLERIEQFRDSGHLTYDMDVVIVDEGDRYEVEKIAGADKGTKLGVWLGDFV